MLRGSYDWVMRLAASRHAALWLAALAFAEGLFFPLPPDMLLMPLVLARRERAWIYAGICLGASVLGGSAGYTVGYFLQPVGRWLISLTGEDVATFQRWYGAWGVFLLALPIPYKLTAIASGMFKLNYYLFLAASLFIRGLRFFLVPVPDRPSACVTACLPLRETAGVTTFHVLAFTAGIGCRLDAGGAQNSAW